MCSDDGCVAVSGEILTKAERPSLTREERRRKRQSDLLAKMRERAKGVLGPAQPESPPVSPKMSKKQMRKLIKQQKRITAGLELDLNDAKAEEDKNDDDGNDETGEQIETGLEEAPKTKQEPVKKVGRLDDQGFMRGIPAIWAAESGIV